MNINLPPELEHLIQGQVTTGRFRSPSEVVGEALRGDSIDGEEFMQGLIDELDAHEVKLKAG